LCVLSGMYWKAQAWNRRSPGPGGCRSSSPSLDDISLQQHGGLNGNSFNLGVLDLPGQPGAWILSSGAVNAAGQATSTTPAACTTMQSASPALFDCLASHGIREAISYQPASRYWPFQWTETAIYLALALALAGYCSRRLNRRLS
jgi:hypothetical protein